MAQPHQCRWLRKTMQLKSGTNHWISCLMSTLSEPLKGITYILPILFSLFHIYSTYRTTRNFYSSYQKPKLKLSAVKQWLWQPYPKFWQRRSRVTCFISFNSRLWKLDILAVQDHEISPACHSLCSCVNTLNSWWIQNSLPPFLLAKGSFNLKSFHYLQYRDNLKQSTPFIHF